MSVLRATPPFRPQSDGVELIGRDAEVWPIEKEEGPPRTPPPPSHDPPHPEDLQPIREEQMDPEVENEVQVRVSVCVCMNYTIPLDLIPVSAPQWLGCSAAVSCENSSPTIIFSFLVPGLSRYQLVHTEPDPVGTAHLSETSENAPYKHLDENKYKPNPRSE